MLVLHTKLRGTLVQLMSYVWVERRSLYLMLIVTLGPMWQQQHDV